MKLKEIITEEKPREKLIKFGVENLTNTELLSILLRTGNKEESINILSNRILKETGTLNKLKSESINNLCKIKGIKKAKACTIVAAFELGKRAFNEPNAKIKMNEPNKIYEKYKNDFYGEKQEKFFVLLCDKKLNLIKKEELYKGTVDSVTIHPREIFKSALLESASFIIIMHNHPTGDTTPSKKDIEFTNRIIEIGELIGIKVIDHIIISSSSYYSFVENSSKTSIRSIQCNR
ncbi:MAG: DNA repair protein RadC [Bacilli bacterium]|nr:DNA repair protein RadC [Bacilli bacterium]